MTELNPFGLDDLIATVEEACNDTFRKDWLLLRLRYARSRAPVPTTGENPYRKLDDEFDHAAEALTWDEGYAAGFAAGRAAATPDPPDDDKRVRVTCFDPATGDSETKPLDPDNYILTLGERCEIKACQVYANGTVQLTIKRGAS